MCSSFILMELIAIVVKLKFRPCHFLMSGVWRLEQSCCLWEYLSLPISIWQWCWGVLLVQVARVAAPVWAAGWALRARNPTLSPREHGDLWPSHRTGHSGAAGADHTDFGTLGLWGYQSPGVPLLRVPPRRQQLELLFYFVILLFSCCTMIKLF